MTTFDEFDKRDFAMSTCRDLGVDPTHCVAIGDSRSDIPLFEVVGFSVAFNASADARTKATIALDSTSVADTIPLVESFLASTQRAQNRLKLISGSDRFLAPS